MQAHAMSSKGQKGWRGGERKIERRPAQRPRAVRARALRRSLGPACAKCGWRSLFGARRGREARPPKESRPECKGTRRGNATHATGLNASHADGKSKGPARAAGSRRSCSNRNARAPRPCLWGEARSDGPRVFARAAAVAAKGQQTSLLCICKYMQPHARDQVVTHTQSQGFRQRSHVVQLRWSCGCVKRARGRAGLRAEKELGARARGLAGVVHLFCSLA